MSDRDNMLPGSMWKIEPLTNDNWLGWKQRVWALLEERELDGYVDGSMARPTESGAMQSTWDKKDQAAMRCIKLTMEMPTWAISLEQQPQSRCGIRSLKSAREGELRAFSRHGDGCIATLLRKEWT